MIASSLQNWIFSYFNSFRAPTSLRPG